MPSEISQTKKDKYCMISLICGILRKKKKSNSETEWKVFACRGAGGIKTLLKG